MRSSSETEQSRAWLAYSLYRDGYSKYRCWIPGKVKIFLSPKRPDQLLGPQQVLGARVKLPGNHATWVDAHSPVDPNGVFLIKHSDRFT
jgi:hypothetical protein